MPARELSTGRKKPPHNITTTPEDWAEAQRLAADLGVSVSQLFGMLVRAESKRRARRAD